MKVNSMQQILFLQSQHSTQWTKTLTLQSKQSHVGRWPLPCYPTVAPSSLRLYTSNAIPGWENNLFMTTLKAGKIFKITLNENGTAVAGEPQELFRSENRYRDIAFGPDRHGTFYVITDNKGPLDK